MLQNFCQAYYLLCVRPAAGSYIAITSFIYTVSLFAHSFCLKNNLDPTAAKSEAAFGHNNGRVSKMQKLSPVLWSCRMYYMAILCYDTVRIPPVRQNFMHVPLCAFVCL